MAVEETEEIQTHIAGHKDPAMASYQRKIITFKVLLQELCRMMSDGLCFDL